MKALVSLRPLSFHHRLVDGRFFLHFLTLGNSREVYSREERMNVVAYILGKKFAP